MKKGTQAVFNIDWKCLNNIIVKDSARLIYYITSQQRVVFLSSPQYSNRRKQKQQQQQMKPEHEKREREKKKRKRKKERERKREKKERESEKDSRR